VLRKIIFTGLALALAWVLGNLLYETWMLGQIHANTPRGLGPRSADYSYSREHSMFLVTFASEVFGVICAVLMLVCLGWMRTKKPSQPTNE
jgi:hypothetical protein